MVKKANRKASIRTEASTEPEPILVHCRLRVPRDKADALLPHLGIAFDCGSAVIRKTRTFVEVEADLEIRTVGDIVAKGVPVLVTKRIPVEPLPAKELIADAAAWFKQIEKLK
jgi:hypothetical protein